MYVVSDGFKVKFSETIYLRSLLRCGITLDKSIIILEKIKKLKKKKITREELISITSNYIEKLVGNKYKERYLIWVKYKELKREKKIKPLIILIGGAPVVGKSVTTTDLSYRLTIERVISTDTIRRIVKSIIKSDILDIPTYEVWKHKNVDVVEGFLMQSEYLKPYVEKIIEKSLKDRKELAIEGVHLVPGLINKNVLHIAIATPSKLLYKRFFLNKMFREGRSFEHLDSCWKINEYFIFSARKHKVHLIRATNLDKIIYKVISIVCSHLKNEMRRVGFEPTQA